MSADLRSLISDLHKSLDQRQLDAAVNLLSRAKRVLLQQNALIPTAQTPPQLFSQAREILELGALTSIRQTDSASFIRYYQQLQPFYDIERHLETTGSASGQWVEPLKTSQRSKITGLYLLLLLSMGDTSQFHTVLEGLIVEASLKGRSVEEDPFIKYPVELERSLMEGSYDKVWRATKSERVPSEDFGLFSNVRPVCSVFCVIFALFAALYLTCVFAGPGRHDPKRNRRLLRKGLPISPHLERQEPIVPRL
jgi:26S proteasome regulatory subunit N12